MTVLPEDVDCLVIGGGPAGSVTAGLLAGGGARVLLLDDGRPRRATPDETLLPGALQALRRVGVHDLVADAAEQDRLRHLAIWGSGELRQQDTGEHGFRLHRQEFDAALRAWASGRGAVVAGHARAVGEIPVLGAGAVRLRVAGVDHAVQARSIVLATGRSGAPGTAPVVEHGPELAAFCVRGGGVRGFADAAVIEAVADGWLWWLPGHDGSATVAVMTDGNLVRTCGSRALVQRMLAAAAGPAACLQEARLLHATRATARLRRPADGLLRVGDAAATIDPLSSQGVEKAIASADHTAAAVRTLLHAPGLRELVLATRWRWERDLWRAHGATAMAFYRQEVRFAQEPFWRARTAGPPPVDATPPAAARLVRSPAAELACGLRRVGDRFEPVEGLTRLGLDDVLTHVRFVPVPPVAAAFATPATLAEGLQRAAADPRLFVLPPRAVHDAVLALWRAGLLTTASAAATR